MALTVCLANFMNKLRLNFWFWQEYINIRHSYQAIKNFNSRKLSLSKNMLFFAKYSIKVFENIVESYTRPEILGRPLSHTLYKQFHNAELSF